MNGVSCSFPDGFVVTAVQLLPEPGSYLQESIVATLTSPACTQSDGSAVDLDAPASAMDPSNKWKLEVYV